MDNQELIKLYATSLDETRTLIRKPAKNEEFSNLQAQILNRIYSNIVYLLLENGIKYSVEKTENESSICFNLNEKKYKCDENAIKSIAGKEYSLIKSLDKENIIDGFPFKVKYIINESMAQEKKEKEVKEIAIESSLEKAKGNNINVSVKNVDEKAPRMEDSVVPKKESVNALSEPINKTNINKSRNVILIKAGENKEDNKKDKPAPLLEDKGTEHFDNLASGIKHVVEIKQAENIDDTSHLPLQDLQSNQEYTELKIGEMIMDAYTLSVFENDKEEKINIVVAPLTRETNRISTPIFAFARTKTMIKCLASNPENQSSIMFDMDGKLVVVRGEWSNGEFSSILYPLRPLNAAGKGIQIKKRELRSRKKFEAIGHYLKKYENGAELHVLPISSKNAENGYVQFLACTRAPSQYGAQNTAVLGNTGVGERIFDGVSEVRVSSKWDGKVLSVDVERENQNRTENNVRKTLEFEFL